MVFILSLLLNCFNERKWKVRWSEHFSAISVSAIGYLLSRNQWIHQFIMHNKMQYIFVKKTFYKYKNFPFPIQKLSQLYWPNSLWFILVIGKISDSYLFTPPPFSPIFPVKENHLHLFFYSKIFYAIFYDGKLHTFHQDKSQHK